MELDNLRLSENRTDIPLNDENMELRESILEIDLVPMNWLVIESPNKRLFENDANDPRR